MHSFTLINKYFISFVIISILLPSSCCDKNKGPIIKCGQIDQSVYLTNQNEIDGFRTSLPKDCNCFLGTLRFNEDTVLNHQPLDFLKCVGGINVASSTAFHEWKGLNKLDSIYGDLTLFNCSLPRLNAFNSLKFVGGTLHYYGSDHLITLDGFNQLEYAKNLVIENNKDLQEINGFKKLGRIDQYLQIKGNKSLLKINKFDNLLNVYINIQIIKNDQLTSISGFPKLNDLRGLLIYDNSKLTDIELPLNNIKEMPLLYIENNASLKKISGFNELVDLYFGGLTISNNPNLSELDAFKKLKQCKDKIIIINNSRLTKCCSFYLPLKNANNETTIEIMGNGMYCNTIDDILKQGACKEIKP